MEVNKKIIFSILLIGFLVITASASTWAYFQDVISSKENSIQIGSIALWVDYTPATPDGQATVSWE
jgi:predicted ribosomally synthesized peptide with SipW-like signal peptide